MSVWQHIEKSPGYQSLEDGKKQGIRRDYFTEFIVPDKDFGKLPEVERRKVYDQFVFQGQVPLENIPGTPITDFVSAQDRLGGQVKTGLEKIGMPTEIQAPGPGMPDMPLAAAHEAPMPAQGPEQQSMVRADGTPKGPGYFGPIDIPGGNVATEFSIGVNLDGQETQIPTLVPTLTEEELALLVNDIIPNNKPVPEAIVNKAVVHAKQRMAEGKNPFQEAELQQAHKEPFRLPEINIPESIAPVFDMDPNILRPYEAKAGEELTRDITKLIAAPVHGLGYVAGLTEIGPETKGMSLEERSKRGEELAARGTEPFMKLEQAIASKTAEGDIEPTGMDIAFEHLMKLGDTAGAKVLKETDNPYLAAAAATTIQAAPILLPFIGKRMPGLFRRVKASTPYRQMAIKERGLVLQTLEETLAKNPDITEGQLARMYPEYFREAKAKRAAPERPFAEEPPITPEGPEPGPIGPAPKPPEPGPAAPKGTPAELAESKQKLETLKQRYAENGIESEIPKVEKAIKAIDDVMAAAPPEAAPSVQVPPFPERRAAQPAPKPAEVAPEVEGVKEPWEMTKSEYINYAFRPGAPGTISKVSGKSLRKEAGQIYAEEKYHKSRIRKALSEGKPVPAKVLKDYPDLQKQPTERPVVEREGVKRAKLAPETREWKDRKDGDVFPEPAGSGYIEIIKKRVKPKTDAVKLAEKTGGEVWINNKYSWSVVRRTKEKPSAKPVSVEPKPEKPVLEDTAKDIDVGEGEPPLAPKEQKKWLLAEVGKAIKEADGEGTITFHVPGDGEFSIINNKEALRAFQKSAKTTFPDRIQPKITGISISTDVGRFTTRPATMRPSQKRMRGEGVEYYNQFQPRKRPGLLEGGERHRSYVDGYYTDESYIVEAPKSKVKKELTSDYEPPISNIIEDGKDAKPAVLVGEFKKEYGEEPLIHAMTKDEAVHGIYNPAYIDNILTLHPEAKPFMAAYPKKPPMLYFKDGDRVVGAVAPLMEAGSGKLEDVIEKGLMPRYLKIKGIAKGSTTKTPSGQATTGEFEKTKMEPAEPQEPPLSGEKAEWSGKEIRPMEVPELTRLAKALLGGKYPQVWRKLRQNVAGDFRPLKGKERIRINAILGADTEQLAKTVAHEIGHLIDFLPEGTMARGNLLGRLASLKKFMKHTISADPKGLPPLTAEDRLRIQKEAKDILLKENAGKLIDEVIRKEIPITPQDVLNIWNLVSEDFPADLHDYIKGLDTAGKKAVVKAALKGEVASELQKFAKSIEEKTGKKIKYKPTAEAIKKKYQELIEKELRKRKAYTINEIRGELENFTMRWKPFNPQENWKFTKYRFSGKELYADFLSAILTDPAFTLKYAPRSWDMWHNYMENKPQVKDLYEKIQAELRAGDVDAKAEQALRVGFAKRETEWALEAKRDITKRMAKDELGYKFIDTAFAVLRRNAKVGETNIPDHINPRYKISDLQYWANEAEGYLIDIDHGILAPMKKAGVDVRDLDSYLFHRRVASERAEKINPEGWTAERSQKKLDEYNDTQPKLKEFAEKFDAARKEWLLNKPAFEEMHSPALIKYINENPGYAKFDITGFAETIYGQEGATQIFREPGVPGKIYRQVGTFRATGPPLTATILNDIRLMRSVVRNEAAKSIVGLYKSFPEDLKGEYVPAKRKWNGKFHVIKRTAHPEMDTMIWLEKGKLHGAYLPKYVVASVQKNPVDAMITARVSRAMAAPFKAIFTQYNPGFMGFNLFRDLNKTVLMLPKAGYPKALFWYAKALKSTYRSEYGIPDPVIKEMQKGKMLISVENYRGDLPEDMMLERLLKRYHMKPKLWENQITRPFQQFLYHLDNVGRGIERLPKVASYMYMKKKFPDLPDDFLAYFVRVGPGSPAFMHRGSAAAFYNNWLLYSNAMKEGHRGMIQAVRIGGPETQKILSGKRRKLEFAYKIVKYHVIPKIAMILAAAGFFGAGIKKIMEGVSEYDMTSYHIIPVGLTPSGRSVYIRIPQDEFGRLMGGITYKLLRAAMGSSKWGLELADYMAGQVPSISPIAGAITDVGAYATGHVPYDTFRMRPAYPEAVGKAGGAREAKAFAKYMSNKMGGGIVHRFSTDNPHEIEKEVEKWIAIPGLSNILGRWIRISDYGVSETIRKEVLDPLRSEDAEKTLKARDGIKKMIQGKSDKVTDAERDAMFEKLPDMQDLTVLKLINRRYGDAILDALLTAQGPEEQNRVWEWVDQHDRKLTAEGND